MALVKQAIDISFAQGLDTKTDTFRVSPGKFLTLENSVFDKGGRLTKRNGFGEISVLPVDTTKYLTTYNGDLTALGVNFEAYSASTQSWINKGNLQPIGLSTLSVIRSASNQSQVDIAVSANGLLGVVYIDNVSNGTTNNPVVKYAVLDATTGQNLVSPTAIPSVASGTPTGGARAFVVGDYFVFVYTNVIAGSSYLYYLALSSINLSAPVVTGQITSSAYITSNSADVNPGLSWDAAVYTDLVSSSATLYIAYPSATGGNHIEVQTINQTLVLATLGSISNQTSTKMSVCIDTTNTSPVIWLAFYNPLSIATYVYAFTPLFAQLFNAYQVNTTVGGQQIVGNVTSVVQNSKITVYQEIINNYGYDATIPTHYIQQFSVVLGNSPSGLSTLVRSVGIASKSFIYEGNIYVLAAYQSPYQPSYFLINSSGQVVSKLAYSNGGGYITQGLPGVTITNDVAQVAYLYKDLVQAANVTSTSASTNVYSQTGINLASFDLDYPTISTGEIGNTLNVSGGFITAYDGVLPVEQGFFVWPDSVETTISSTGGLITANTYFYEVTYEWTDNQGNLYRSAPSIPVTAVTTGSTSSVTLNIPTLRLTYKINNPVTIVIYRWSQAQEIYYQVTSITVPILNNTTVDYVTYTDTLSDSQILGNNIIYTNGNVIENISPPASNIITLFNNRVWLVDSEDMNLLWYSQQVFEDIPVQFSDLLTLYVAPTTASEGSTGPITALSPMDDKLIIFKNNALGYINGIGPDATGANSTYSDFTLINTVVGCTNQQSIVFMPQGLMFQTNKGIWLLDRNLNTQYIGAPVESLTTGATVLSAINVPATNQVRFTLDSGITLIYDYFYAQWGTFTNIPAVSSTIYQNLHTYVNSYGQVFQETPGVYLDNTFPVLMSFTTSWITLGGIQGFERFYDMLFLGTYVTPFNLNVSFAFNYNPSYAQSVIVTPAQSSTTWGSDNLWGSGVSWGDTPAQGNADQANVFEARVFPNRQKCESFQINVSEVFNASVGTQPGEGLTLSGLQLNVGVIKGQRNSRAARNFG